MNETCPSCGDTFTGEEGCLAPPIDNEGTIYLDEPEVWCCIPCAHEINAEATCYGYSISNKRLGRRA